MSIDSHVGHISFSINSVIALHFNHTHYDSLYGNGTREYVSKLKESLSEHHCEFSNDIEEKIVGDKDDLLRHIERCRNGFIFHLQDTEN